MNPHVAIASALALGWLVAPVLAQQQVYVTLREVRFAVTDRQGAPVVGLSQADFTVYDNDRPQDIASFVTNVQSPVSLALVLDRSRSLESDLPTVVDAAAAFASTVIHDDEDQGAVIAFDSKVYLLQPWTSDVHALSQTVHSLTAAGGSSIFDAVVKACRDQFDPADIRQKALVLVTDGEDTTSRATLDDAISMARLSRVAIYVLGVRSSESLNPRELQGQRVLASLAELTGGRVFYPAGHSTASLAESFRSVEAELRTSYRLSYYLEAPPDNAFHRVRVVPKQPALAVHAPSGYTGHQPRPTS